MTIKNTVIRDRSIGILVLLSCVSSESMIKRGTRYAKCTSVENIYNVIERLTKKKADEDYSYKVSQENDQKKPLAITASLLPVLNEAVKHAKKISNMKLILKIRDIRAKEIFFDDKIFYLEEDGEYDDDHDVETRFFFIEKDIAPSQQCINKFIQEHSMDLRTDLTNLYRTGRALEPCKSDWLEALYMARQAQYRYPAQYRELTHQSKRAISISKLIQHQNAFAEFSRPLGRIGSNIEIIQRCKKHAIEKFPDEVKNVAEELKSFIESASFVMSRDLAKKLDTLQTKNSYLNDFYCAELMRKLSVFVKRIDVPRYPSAENILRLP